MLSEVYWLLDSRNEDRNFTDKLGGDLKIEIGRKLSASQSYTMKISESL